MRSRIMSAQLATVLTHIDELDLEPIAFKLVHPEPGEKGMEVEEAKQAVGLYRQFLKLVAAHPDKSIVPTKVIDKVWHTHILDTAKYAEDCNRIFGRFIHHFPYLGLRGDADVQAWETAFEETRQLFLEHFGTQLPQGAMECGGGCSDGGSSCDYSVNSTLNLRERPRLPLAA